MRSRANFLKLFATAMILVLLTVRLGCFTQEVFVTPVADCLFGSAFIATEEPDEGKLRKFIKAHDLLDAELFIALPDPAILPVVGAQPLCPASPHLTNHPAEIFIPPELAV